ncbi:hypothetical protein EWB00_009944 [Schistosoma japonicum]|uniref:Uncharacterized protein n=1 Tax=Schistosoma japonicum TaxID=6182 RepID=A0A4Z2DQK4_SCHJA|nr:hypothetical protein EWB00_009944 [Schistosoma japonicum]
MNSFSLTIVLLINMITLQSCLCYNTGGYQQINQYGRHSLNQSVIQQSVVLANKMFNSLHWFTPNDVTNTTTQIVAGLMFRYNLHLVQTNCTKKSVFKHVSNTNGSKCRRDNKTAGAVCRVQVLYQPWEKNEYDIKIISCQSKVEPSPKKENRLNKPIRRYTNATSMAKHQNI